MNYPNWYLPEIGGGLLIAIIAIAHVVISHLAVGGGLFLVLTEIRARKTNDYAMLDYVRRHTNFFVLLTMVFGGVSGVGIWFIIALVNPAATSTLIHNFVFGWAIEWVFFICEIIALLIYSIRFDKMKPKDHIMVGWLYFIFAWLSLFVINGILGFMLTPGAWIEEGGFWRGFFNPSFLPALIFRTCIALIFAGVFGLVTGAFSKDETLRHRVSKYCASWLYLPVAVLLLSGLYYTSVIGTDAFENLFHFNAEGGIFLKILIISSILLFLVGLTTFFKLKGSALKIISLTLVLLATGWMGGFEYLREIARKPYVLYNYMYSHGVTLDQVNEINDQGILSFARWTEIREVDQDNPLPAGKEIFKLQCMACHTMSGYNGIANKIATLTEQGVLAHLTGQGLVRTYMPPFMGSEQEKQALATWLDQEVNQMKWEGFSDYEPPQESHTVPPFDPAHDQYVLLVWNDLGMKCISDNDAWFVFLPPANTLQAQLFKRGEKPEIITRGITLLYEVESPYLHPENHVPFWDFAPNNFGVNLKPGTGLAGKGMTGEFDPDGNAFKAERIPVVPYRDHLPYNPYPIFTIRAIEKSSGEVLIETKVVAPNSTEMGCRNCHGGGWRVDGLSGMSDETAINILSLHDKYQKTDLLKEAEKGNPRLCQSCHEDPVLGASGQPGVLNFSAAVHGFHANYLRERWDDACNMCHPSHPDGNTNCMRGRHAEIGISCAECHGTMEDHALGLLQNEKVGGKSGADRLMKGLLPRMTESVAEVKPRSPWSMQPDCTSCHTWFNITEDGWDGPAFNKWTPGFEALYRNRTDNQGVRCIACHGSTHAVYPAFNKYDPQRDNIQPVQYQKIPGTIGTQRNCKVCHTKEMPYSGHHRNMLR